MEKKYKRGMFNFSYKNEVITKENSPIKMKKIRFFNLFGIDTKEVTEEASSEGEEEEEEEEEESEVSEQSQINKVIGIV